ncbi:uncharacterized protein [Aegilops tauschii subsp. strangulata]|uniref:uncharacterized protein n=1 Tax=Aegilops tauschii subsp. strangulata TaxID=200361 RepID=UPI003CC87628
MVTAAPHELPGWGGWHGHQSLMAHRPRSRPRHLHVAAYEAATAFIRGRYGAASAGQEVRDKFKAPALKSLQVVDKMKAASFLPANHKSFIYMPACGTAGGLLVAWDDSVLHGLEMAKHRFSISVSFQSRSNNDSFVLSTVYTPCDEEERDDFFAVMTQTAKQVTGSWIILGDFNMYRFPHEKSQRRKNWALMDRFNSWIREHALDDIDITNRSFTWSNKREEPTLIKLDRVLVNAEWNLGFLNTTAAALPATTLDHVLIGVELSREAIKSPLFRFENHWLHIPELRDIISQSWGKGTRTFASLSTLLNFKLRRLRAAIRAWERTKPPTQNTLANCKHVVQYMDAVEERGHLPRIEVSLRNHANLKAQQLILWQTSFWKRRAKIRGCTLGDENTRFFHAVANCQHRRNKIKLLVKDGT